MKIIVLLILLPIYTCNSSSLDALRVSVEKQIDHKMFHGVEIGIYNSRSKEEQFLGFGKISNRNENVPNKNHIYEIGSITKVFTAIILSSLHLEKIVNILDPIEKFIPELKGKVAGAITLKELSTHMSGLPRLPTNMGKIDSLNPYAKYNKKKLLSYLLSIKNLEKPEKFSWENYSNVGVGLLGYALEKASNNSYPQLLKKYITLPLGMADTVITVTKENKDRFVPGHNKILEETSYWNLNILVAAGGIKSSAKDMMAFLKANLEPETTSIKMALLFAQKTQYKNKDEMIALGWAAIDNEKGRGISHSGGTGGFSSKLQISFSHKKGFLSLINTSRSIQCLGKILIIEKDCTPKFPLLIDEEILEQYVGTYIHKETQIVFVLSKVLGQLYYEIPGQEKGILEALNQKKFTIQGIVTIEFTEEETFNFTQNGQTLVFKKE